MDKQIVQRFNWFKGSIGLRIKLVYWFKVSSNSLVKGFNWLKGSTGSIGLRFQPVQGFKWFNNSISASV